MATKRTRSTASKTKTAKRKTTSKRKSSSKSSRPALAPEPIAARVMQAVLLILAVLLLFNAFIPSFVGLILVGLLVLLTGFPPVRGPVDQWLTGKRRGKSAEQAAAIRMAVGAGVVLLTLLNAFTQL